MIWATANSDFQGHEHGGIELVEPTERVEHELSATRAGLLLVPVEPPRPALRGRLALLIESAVEGELERRGAPPPGVGAASDLDASLSDQLYRARLVGGLGLAISLHSLEGIANLAGALDAEDSAVLRWWLAATRERPVRMILASVDRDLGIYDEPLPLHALLATPQTEGVSVPRAAPEVAHSSATMELSELPPAVAEAASQIVVRHEPTPSPLPAETRQENDAEALMRAMAAIFADDEPVSAEREVEPTSDGDDATYAFEPSDVEALPAVEEMPEPPFSVEAATAPVPTPAPSDEVSAAAMEPAPQATEELEPEADAAPEAATAPELVEQPEETAPDPTPISIAAPVAKKSGPLDPNAPSEWQRWVGDLEGTRGPKPLAVVERTFVTSFVPLMDAEARGITGPEAAPVLTAWSKSFEKSYSEAFDALRVRGKRPTMVLDVPDLALRIGRLHGARAAQLILVDGMRFDLGLRVNERLKPLLGQHAALTERLLLWSALPTTTAVQLELLGRGPQGLKERSEEIASDVPVARGRAAATLRRIRAGQREVLKLDIVESAMSVPGGPLAERLDDLADETAEALANHLLRLPARTLAVIFADHGFALDSIGSGTSAARSGGASPEEVLVPAFVWLCGAVH